MRSSAERPLALGLKGPAVTVAVCAAVALGAPAVARASAYLYFRACGTSSQNIFTPYTQSGFHSGVACPTSGGSPQAGVWLSNLSSTTSGGSVAHWEADAPPGIELDGVYINAYSIYNPSAYFNEQFYWQGGGSGYLTNLNGGTTSYSQTFANSSYFGWQIACSASIDCANRAYFDVYNISLSAQEVTSPALHADFGSNLWYKAGRWIRGSFPIQLDAEDSSGVCQATFTWNGQRNAEPATPTAPNQTYWNQCDPGNPPGATQYFFPGQSIDTTSVAPQSAGNVPLQITATDAAQNTTSYTENFNIDNIAPQLTLSGPTQAAAGAGTQYVTATATAGPSGVGSINCSDDGSPWISEVLSGAGSEKATAEIPVAGLGAHAVSCYATNRSYAASGAGATTTTQTLSVHIGEPVSARISFGRVIEHCRGVVKKVKVPGHWVSVRRHHKWVRVHRRGRTRNEHVLACHIVTPDRHVARVAFGHRVTVSGALSAQGIALSHVPVRILAAVDNGRYRWRTVAVALTSADGRWTARLRPGPSRLIEAVYDGGSTTLSAGSRVVRTVVPARIDITPSSAHVPWGGVLVIHGRLLGGFIPQEQLLEVLSGAGRHLHIIGIQFIRRSGRFTIKLAALGGGGALHTQVAVGTLRETNYAYAHGVSRRVSVTLG